MIWDPYHECMDVEERAQLQVRRLRETVARLMANVPVYCERFKEHDIRPEDITSMDDLKRLPFTTKDDLRDTYPFGLFATPVDETVRVHASSGTTGKPTVVGYTAEDIDIWAEVMARSIGCSGGTPHDILQVAYGYGLFTGGLGLHYGAERVGLSVIPIGGGNTRRQIQTMKDFQTTVLHVTPSYLLHLHGKLSECGIRQGDLALRKAFIGAEPHSENARLRIEELWRIDAYNSYGLSELNGPGMAFECVYKTDLHLWEDAYILEIIDPQTGQVLPDGQEGEVVLTNLIRRAMPILRYRTRDLASVHTDACPCGRTHRRLSRIMGRTDDMLIINGVNVFPSQIEEKIMRIPEVGTNYLIHVDKREDLDRLTVKVEIYPKMFRGDPSQLEGLKQRIKEDLKASIVINPNVELHEQGSLPVSEGKAKRVVDERPRL